MRKPVFCICENKGSDQLWGNRATDQRLQFRFIDSAIPLLPKSEISSFRGWSCEPNNQLLNVCTTSVTEGEVARVKLV